MEAYKQMSVRKNTTEIWLIRHAHATWKHPELHDFARALDARGRKEALALGSWVVQKNLKPACILVSPSVRTLQTFHIVFPTQNVQQQEVHILPQLYLGGAFDLLAALEAKRHIQGPCVLIGHNPGISELGGLLKPGFSEEMATGSCHVFSGNNIRKFTLKHSYRPDVK
jgi:phosphohistidine phosphatase